MKLKIIKSTYQGVDNFKVYFSYTGKQYNYLGLYCTVLIYEKIGVPLSIDEFVSCIKHRDKLQLKSFLLKKYNNYLSRKNNYYNFNKNKLLIKNKYKKALIYLKKAFDLNIKAHNYVEYSQESYYDNNHGLARYYSDKKWYKYQKKAFYIKKAIQVIKDNSLKIKYGIDKEEKVIYFHYKGEQISFHYVGDRAPTNKKYKGKWKGKQNLTFPFKI